ncbi:uncharacterized protein BX663DRAFT_561049 [Cokeromyces recurvatus]|uniref:uncharacterized protein n=1 Tax=Cokeromyces recurvatus TaxID=90255 RepID=UPI002220DB46|nr:uncharacterized protein BX663DRAFT_561049 [Cokeromyces recurvatus]KAI7902970.1 hypothetical protein BX663DRAFT_561049 [Cokeromyces recurvatus]
MIFQRNTDLLSIRNFYITTGGGYEKAIAYGPGSVINGSLTITNDKPLSAYNIRVIFKCEEIDTSKKEKITTTLFSIDSVIWGNLREESHQQPNELSNGSHMYLFAVRLPHVNYPPSMQKYHFAHHRIKYSLQGFLDLTSLPSPYTTPIVPVLYLPFITSHAMPSKRMTQLWLFHQKEEINKRIGITAELIKPVYCPGDICTIKMTTNNKSGTKISSVQIAFVAILTTSSSSVNDDHVEIVEYTHKRHTLLTESFYVSIPKYAQEHQDVFQFHLPIQLVPTFTNKLGKLIDIAYEVNLSIIPYHQQGASLLFRHHNTVVVTDDTTATESNTISLPIIIGTIPSTYPLLAHQDPPVIMTVDDDVNDSTLLPTFIPTIDSPEAVVNDCYRDYSVSPSNSFQVASGLQDIEELTNHVQQDASGYLMVPDTRQ